MRWRRGARDGASESSGCSSHFRFPSKKYGTASRLLGQGVTSEVFLYSLQSKSSGDESGASLYAVKSFVKKNLKDADEVKSICKEVEIHRRVNDTFHVVELFEFFSLKINTQYFMVLEYMPFSLLDLYLKYGTMMPLIDRMCFFKQVVNCLCFLQSENVGHRDIKLENCCVDHSGKVKLIDLGSATVGNVGYGMAGSPSYSAPEIHKSLKYDSFICDLWSIGILLINLFYGSKQKWKNARHDDVLFCEYASNPSIGNVVRSFNKTSSEDTAAFLAVKERVDQLILQLLTIDPCQRITLLQLAGESAWFQNVSCCHLYGAGTSVSGHSHGKFLCRPQHV